MKAINKENDLCRLEKRLLRLIATIKDLEKYTEETLLGTRWFFGPIRKNVVSYKFSIFNFKNRLQRFNKALLDSFEEVKKFKEHPSIQEDLYDFKDYFKFQNLIVKEISYNLMVEKLRSIKIRAAYHLLEINMIKLDLYRDNRQIFNKDIDNYIRCEYFLDNIVYYWDNFQIDGKKLLGKNNAEESIRTWTSILDGFSSKNEEKIKRRKPMVPNLFKLRIA